MQSRILNPLSCFLITLLCGVFFDSKMVVSATILSRIQHQLYFKQTRYSEILNEDKKPMIVLNTLMGEQVYDRNQNIGIMLAPGLEHDFCTQTDMSPEKLVYLRNSLHLQMYIFIQVTDKCKFGVQVGEAVRAGAKGVILFDPSAVYTHNPIPAVSTAGINVPVLIVEAGAKGKQLLDILKSEDYDGAYALCHISFSQERKQQFPLITYFSQSTNKEARQFLDSLYEFILAFDPVVNITVQAIPKIYSINELTAICQSENCIETTESQILKQDCYDNGRFCAIHTSKYLKPQEILDHEIFQYKLSTVSSLGWARYMRGFIPECLEVAERGDLKVSLQSCGEELLRSYDPALLTSVLKFVRSSWSTEDPTEEHFDKKTTNNKSLDFARNLVKAYGIQEWPTIILNGAPIADSKLYMKDFFTRTLCSSYLFPSKACLKFMHYGVDSSSQQNENDDDGGDDFNPDLRKAGKVIKQQPKPAVAKGWVITLSLLSGFFIGGLIFWIMRRNHIRSMNQLLHSKVRDAVHKYNQFNDANTQFQQLV